ncbi:hypothetical protein H5T88_08315 [bacterium]|nr:hypothetical protein [bacterium]
MFALINLLAVLLNPGFEAGQLDRFYSPPNWLLYVIKAPARGELSTDAHRGNFSYLIKTREISSPLAYSDFGKAFLQSDVFSVEAGKKYRLSLWVRGDGKAGMQILWWERYDEVATPCGHQIDSSDLIPCKNEWQEISLELSPPPKCKVAYIRLIAEEGNVYFDDVVLEVK